MNMSEQSARDREQDEFLVSQYLDGSLGASDVRDLLTRVDSDPELARLLASFQAVDRSVADWSGEIPGDVDWGRFERDYKWERTAVVDRVSGGRWVYRLLVPLSAAAAILLVATLMRESNELTSTGVVERFSPIASVDFHAPATFDVRDSLIEYRSPELDRATEGLFVGVESSADDRSFVSYRYSRGFASGSIVESDVVVAYAFVGGGSDDWRVGG
jgi:hypothetical protein